MKPMFEAGQWVIKKDSGIEYEVRNVGETGDYIRIAHGWYPIEMFEPIPIDHIILVHEPSKITALRTLYSRKGALEAARVFANDNPGETYQIAQVIPGTKLRGQRTEVVQVTEWDNEEPE